MPSYADTMQNRFQSTPLAAEASNWDAMDIDRPVNAVDEIATQRAQPAWLEAMEVDSSFVSEENEVLPPLAQGVLLLCLDTNILIDHLRMLRDLADFLSLAIEHLGAPPAVLVIPRIVLHELDRLKLSSKQIEAPLPPRDLGSSASSRHASGNAPQRRARVALSSVVREASTWLIESMRSRALVVRGQRAQETLSPPAVRLPADDLILDAARFWQSRQNQAILVTSDKILTAKALSEGMRALAPRPASDLRAFLSDLHPELVSLLDRGEAVLRTKALHDAPPPALRLTPVAVNGTHANGYTAEEDAGMQLDDDLIMEAAAPAIDLKLTGRAKIFVDSQAYFVSCLLTAFDVLFPDAQIANGVSAIQCLDLLDRKWADLVTTRYKRKSHSPGKLEPIQSEGVRGSRWNQAASRSPPPSPEQETAAEAAALRAQRETMLALRATLATTKASSVHQWSRGRWQQLVGDYGAVLELLRDFDAFDDEFLTPHLTKLHEMLAL